MLKRKKALQAIASNNGPRLSTTKQKLNQTVSSMDAVFLCPQFSSSYWIHFTRNIQCPLFNVPTVSRPMSDRPIQATPTPTILNNCNAVSHRHRWRCSACRLPKRQDSRLLQAQPSVLWLAGYWSS